MKPNVRPSNPRFSSGPCTKHPGWTPDIFKSALLGRSHRSKDGKALMKKAVEKTRKVLGIPKGYQIVITPASDTGAVEMALWSMLGSRPVEVLAWENFGQDWVKDIQDHLPLENVHAHAAPYGESPDFSRVNTDNDVVFTWNGTTSGVRVPNGDWIPDQRKGLTICDATSAIFGMALPWSKLDVTTYSWQKVLGGEAQHGIMILSPRAIDHLENYTPPWPLPKLFRLTKGGKVDAAKFEGSTINTPSLLCVWDYLDALAWAEKEGGVKGLIERTEKNARVVFDWIEKTPWVENLAKTPETRSVTSICLKITADWFQEKDEDTQNALIKKLVSLLEGEGVAYDINAYRAAPPGLRIWAGATVETEDLQALLPWLEWGFEQVRKENQNA